MRLLLRDRILAAIYPNNCVRTGPHVRSCSGWLYRINNTHNANEICNLHRLICYRTVRERTKMFFNHLFLVQMPCFSRQNRMLERLATHRTHTERHIFLNYNRFSYQFHHNNQSRIIFYSFQIYSSKIRGLFVILQPRLTIEALKNVIPQIFYWPEPSCMCPKTCNLGLICITFFSNGLHPQFILLQFLSRIP